MPRTVSSPRPPLATIALVDGQGVDAIGLGRGRAPRQASEIESGGQGHEAIDGTGDVAPERGCFLVREARYIHALPPLLMNRSLSSLVAPWADSISSPSIGGMPPPRRPRTAVRSPLLPRLSPRHCAPYSPSLRKNFPRTQSRPRHRSARAKRPPSCVAAPRPAPQPPPRLVAAGMPTKETR